MAGPLGATMHTLADAITADLKHCAIFDNSEQPLGETLQRLSGEYTRAERYSTMSVPTMPAWA